MGRPARAEATTTEGAAASSSHISAKTWIYDIDAYQGGQSKLAGVDHVLKLSSNENPMGPSPRALEAFRRAADQLGAYPDGSATQLREALAGAHGLDADRIVCGAGSDELISLICQCFAGPGDEVIHTARGFAMYRISALAAGATPVAAAERGLTADPEALSRAVTPRTRVLFLANPNNPTGTYLNRDALTALADALPSHVLLVIDGAYAEYMRRADFDDGFALATERPNVAVTRTFSKIHGLAALRLGWMYGAPTVVDPINRVRGPFNVSAPALAAGAAAVADVAFVDACAIQNEVWRDWLTKELRSLGIETEESFGNFVLPRFGERGPTSAAAADGFLRSRGIIVRRMESYGMPDRLRITVGSSSDNVAVAKALHGFLDAAAAAG